MLRIVSNWKNFNTTSATDCQTPSGQIPKDEAEQLRDNRWLCWERFWENELGSNYINSQHTWDEAGIAGGRVRT